MASLGFSFDASTVEPAQSGDFSPLPAGDYVVQIIESEMLPTKNGDGQYLKLVHEVVDGDYRGRKLWSNLTLVHANPETVSIAQRTLASICHALGKMNVSDSEELHFQQIVAYVKMIPAGTTRKNGYRYEKDTNEIGGYKPVTAQAPAPRAAAPVARPMAQPAPRPAAPAPAAAAAGGAKALPWAAARR